MKKIKFGRDNIALTFFVPNDCKSKCSFCTTKEIYKKISKVSNEEYIETIQRVIKKFKMKELVISGGEPFHNLDFIIDVINNIDENIDIYINTMFPILKSPFMWLEDVIELDRKLDFIFQRISGLNISRHCGNNYSKFETLEQIKALVKGRCNIRVNVLLDKQISKDETIFSDSLFMQHLRNIMKYKMDIQLRADYTKTSLTDEQEFSLFDNADETSKFLANNFKYISSSKCNVCSTNVYSFVKGCNISYHRGLVRTSIDNKKYLEVNDVIIFPNGKVYLDWDGEPIDNLDDIHLIIPRKRSNRGYKSCGIQSYKC